MRPRCVPRQLAILLTRCRRFLCWLLLSRQLLGPHAVGLAQALQLVHQLRLRLRWPWLRCYSSRLGPRALAPPAFFLPASAGGGRVRICGCRATGLWRRGRIVAHNDIVVVGGNVLDESGKAVSKNIGRT